MGDLLTEDRLFTVDEQVVVVRWLRERLMVMVVGASTHRGRKAAARVAEAAPAVARDVCRRCCRKRRTRRRRWPGRGPVAAAAARRTRCCTDGGGGGGAVGGVGGDGADAAGDGAAPDGARGRGRGREPTTRAASCWTTR